MTKRYSTKHLRYIARLLYGVPWHFDDGKPTEAERLAAQEAFRMLTGDPTVIYERW